MRLNARRIVVRERSSDAREVRMREVENARVVRWYMTDEERLEESRRVDGVESVRMADLGLSQPPRRGEKTGKVRRVAIRWYRWLKG